MAGTSDYRHIPCVLDLLTQIDPSSLLDVGVGFGKWGVLCRDVLELSRDRVHRDTWTRRIDGVEIFEPYRNPVWDAVYDHVYIGSALDVLERVESYDVILCGDVIEHLDKRSGQRLLEKMLDRAKVVIVISPGIPYPQGALFGNEHERHLSEWRRQDFAGIPHRYQDIGTTFVAVLSRDAHRLTTVRMLHPFLAFGVCRGSVEWLRLLTRRLTDWVFNHLH